jgi:hypothetical protein
MAIRVNIGTPWEAREILARSDLAQQIRMNSVYPAVNQCNNDT